MNKDQRAYMAAAAANNKGNQTNSNLTTLSNFQYRPPNNTGTILGLIGGVLTTAGDTLAIIGTIIQLNSDASADFQSQLDDFKSDKEKETMQNEIDALKEKVELLEKFIKSNQK